MSAVIAEVASIDGKFYVQNPDGDVRKELRKGAQIHEGEIVVGSNGNSNLNSMIVTMNDGIEIVMFGNESQLFDVSLLEQEFAINETISESDSITLLVQNDILDVELNQTTNNTYTLREL